MIMENNIKTAPAICTQCGGKVEVNISEEIAVCPYCGTSFIIEKAVNNYNVKNARIDHADNVNIDMSGAVKEVLGFVGDQIKEGREDRRERRRQSAEMEKNFFKIFGLMFAAMLIFGLIAFIILQFTG